MHVASRGPVLGRDAEGERAGGAQAAGGRRRSPGVQEEPGDGLTLTRELRAVQQRRIGGEEAGGRDEGRAVGAPKRLPRSPGLASSRPSQASWCVDG
ncbi:hypothetical protein ZWY2020_039878 [Hordeum vulgare]|nr:hypothetical protein ZWY2020_039878 [Hordeum vulgare]